MIPRRRGVIDVSRLELCVRQYLDFYPLLVKRRQHYTLLKVLDFLRDELGVSTVDDVLKKDVKSLALSLQKYVNRCVSEGRSYKSILFNLYLVRSFLSFHGVEIDQKKIKVPRKAGKTRIDRVPSIAELQKLILGTRSQRMRLAIMTMALTGMRLNECLSLRREWVDLEKNIITLPAEVTKAGKPREIPIPSELREELRHYLENYPYVRGYLFCAGNNPEKRIPTTRFYELYVKLLKRLKLDAKTPDGSAYALHPHTLRKFYKTMLESAGVNRLLIDMWMGHRSGIDKHYYLPPPEAIMAEMEKVDRALKIFGSLPPSPDIEQRLEALEQAVRDYEAILGNAALLRRLLRGEL